MGGVKDSFGEPSLASKLRKEADEVRDKHDVTKLNVVYNEALKQAKLSAKLGNYSVNVYHEHLVHESIVRALQKQLSKDGFICSKVHEDAAYSEHAQQTMLFITVSW